MAARKLTVSTPFGTFTRRTPRTYTHVVVTCGVNPQTTPEAK